MAQPDPEIDSDEDEDDDDVKIVLLQPEEFDQPEGDGEEEEAHAEEGGEELLEAADEGEKVADGAAPSTPAGATPAKGSGKASDQRHKTWVNPNLQSADGGAAASAAKAAAKAEAAKASAAKARLGPVAHMPGGTEVDLDAVAPDNIDLDSVQVCPSLPPLRTPPRAGAAGRSGRPPPWPNHQPTQRLALACALPASPRRQLTAPARPRHRTRRGGAPRRT